MPDVQVTHYQLLHGAHCQARELILEALQVVNRGWTISHTKKDGTHLIANRMPCPLPSGRVLEVSDGNAVRFLVDDETPVVDKAGLVFWTVAPRNKLVAWEIHVFAGVRVEPSFSESREICIKFFQMLSHLGTLDLIQRRPNIDEVNGETRTRRIWS